MTTEATRGSTRIRGPLLVYSGTALLCLSLSACNVGPDTPAADAGGARGGIVTARVAVTDVAPAERPVLVSIEDPPVEAPLEDAPVEAPLEGAPEMIPADPIPLPHYDVIAERSGDRRDDMKTYFIVMDGVDPATDGFKAAVKQILRVVARVNRGTEFSALVWDDLLAAQTEAAYRSAPDMFTEVQLEAKNARNERHLIASYQGGVETVGQPPAYVTSWFPNAGLFSPEVGMWVSSEVWRP